MTIFPDFTDFIENRFLTAWHGTASPIIRIEMGSFQFVASLFPSECFIFASVGGALGRYRPAAPLMTFHLEPLARDREGMFTGNEEARRGEARLP